MTVHSLAHARMALGCGVPVTVLSAPSAGAYAGVGWWLALARAAGAAVHVLDCGPAPGRALEALRAGQRLLIVDAPPAQWADIAARAAAAGGAVLPVRPPSLDLGQHGAERRLAEWLQTKPF